MFLAIMAVVFLLDTIELIRRSANKENVPISLILEMATLKAPEIGQKIFPFSVLFGSMMVFTKMVKNQELIAAQSAGVSIWQFLLPALDSRHNSWSSLDRRFQSYSIGYGCQI